MATIAHEINNPLDALTNLMHLLRKSSSLDSEAAELVDMAERDLAQETRAGLEHAMAVQRRIIGIIARAIRGAAPAPRYGATGAMAAERPVAFTVSARA